MAASFLTILCILAVVAAASAALALWWIWPRKDPAYQPPAPKTRRCRTITFTYSDGSQRTFHSALGEVEFTDRFGKRFAPKGTTLVSAKGGAHAFHQ